MRHLTAILLAAGKGERFVSKTAKPLIGLGGLPLIAHSLIKLNSVAAVKEIVLVVNRENYKGIIRQADKQRIKKLRRVVFGGRRRQDSVACGLCALSAQTDLVLIHDSARPLFDKKAIPMLVRKAKESGAALLGVPVKATIKRTRGLRFKGQRGALVAETLKRDALWEAQTPQVFKKELILKAYKRFGRSQVTDDASLLEKLGVKVALVRGSYSNIKITTREDLIIAKTLFAGKRL